MAKNDREQEKPKPADRDALDINDLPESEAQAADVRGGAESTSATCGLTLTCTGTLACGKPA